MSKIPMNRMLDGLPVVDAVAPLRVQPGRQDIKGAKRGDPCDCVYARAIKRQLESSRVWIFGKTAYVQTLDAGGNSRYERFIIPKASQEYIKYWDVNGKAEPAGFVFSPPPPSKRLGGSGLKAGPKTGPKRKSRGATTPREAAFVPTRSGTGKVKYFPQLRFHIQEGGPAKIRS